MKESTEKMSKTKLAYTIKLIIRCIIFILLAILFFKKPEEFDILKGWRFFDKFSVLHILWAIWIFDMIIQLLPVKAYISLGSQKYFLQMFKPSKKEFDRQKLKKYIADTTKTAYKVMILWVVANVAIYVLYFTGVINLSILYMITAFYYVGDLICVVIWCPFRFLMRNRCCTTCRIFNWDHFMMFTPFIIVPGFYSWTLAALAIAIWIVWEMCVLTYPERFWEKSNVALRCSECTDKLCNQNCKKIRK